MPSTIDQLSAQLALTGIGWDAQRWANFMALTPEEQALEVQMLQDASVSPSRDVWREVLQILLQTAVIAGAIAGIAGAITAVRVVAS